MDLDEMMAAEELANPDRFDELHRLLDHSKPLNPPLTADEVHERTYRDEDNILREGTEIRLHLSDEQMELLDHLRADETGTHVSRPCSREDYVRASVLLRLIKANALPE